MTHHHVCEFMTIFSAYIYIELHLPFYHSVIQAPNILLEFFTFSPSLSNGCPV